MRTVIKTLVLGLRRTESSHQMKAALVKKAFIDHGWLYLMGKEMQKEPMMMMLEGAEKIKEKEQFWIAIG